MADRKQASNPMMTDFLFVRPSFWLGAGRVLDLFGPGDRYNFSQTPEDADARALFSDWRMVGQDLAAAMRSVHDELK